MKRAMQSLSVMGVSIIATSAPYISNVLKDAILKLLYKTGVGFRIVVSNIDLDIQKCFGIIEFSVKAAFHNFFQIILHIKQDSLNIFKN